MNQPLPFHGATYNVIFNNSRAATNSLQTRANSGVQHVAARTSHCRCLPASRSTTRATRWPRRFSGRSPTSSSWPRSRTPRPACARPTGTCGRPSSRSRFRQRALDLANRLYQDNKIKVEIGTLAPIDTMQSEAQVAVAEQVAACRAQIGWQTAELNLKRLLVSGPDDDLYQPDDQPDGTGDSHRAERRYSGGRSRPRSNSAPTRPDAQEHRDFSSSTSK